MVRLKEGKLLIACKDNKFQFLMVRLKEYTRILIPSRKIISIPYGAIKRAIPKIKDVKYIQISIPYGAIKSFMSYGRKLA